jgi:hypothetical protein
MMRKTSGVVREMIEPAVWSGQTLMVLMSIITTGTSSWCGESRPLPPLLPFFALEARFPFGLPGVPGMAVWRRPFGLPLLGVTTVPLLGLLPALGVLSWEIDLTGSNMVGVVICGENKMGPEATIRHIVE